MIDWLPEIRRRLAAAGLDPAREAEIAQELAQHLDDRYAEMRALGADEDAARDAALAELNDDVRMRGELSRIERRESTLPPAGDPGRPPFLPGLWQDVRHGARMLRRNPGFTALAMLTLALGVGATTVVYAIVDNVLLRPVPYAHIERLVRILEVPSKDPSRTVNASYPNFEDWRARSRTIAEMGIFRSRTLVLTDGEPERVTAGMVTPGFFAAAGARAARGRLFTEADGAVGAPPVMVISHAAWQRRFGSDPEIVGRMVRAVDGPREIVGVLAPVDMYRGELEFWMALTRTSGIGVRGARQMWVMGRLADGATLEQARAELEGIAGGLAAAYPDSNAGWSVRLTPMQEWSVGGMRAPLYTFLGAVGCILLIACANVAGLLVARGTARVQEVAVRRALGADRGRIVRQLLTESLLLALAGGGFGALLAWWTVPLLVPLFPLPLPAERIAVDVRVLATAVAASALTGLLFGIVPALGLSRAPIKAQGRSTSAWGVRIGRGLIVAEVALSLVLLAGAGLMVRTLLSVYAVSPGIDVDQLVALRAIPLLPPDAAEDRALQFYRSAIERVTALPGVESAAGITTAPFSGDSVHSLAVPEGGTERVPVSPRSVTPGYFRTMGIPLVAGRDFTPADRGGTPRAVIVNESGAARLFPGQSALGRLLHVAGSRQPYEVVGIAGDVRHEALDSDVLLEIYHPVSQRPDWPLTIVARTASPVLTASAFRSLVPELPETALVAEAAPFAGMLGRTTFDRRNRAILLGVLGALGVLLAAVGVFGVTAYAVNQRTKEIGVRMALGADGPRVLRTVVGSQLLPIGGGVALGVLGSWWAMRTLTAFLFGVQPTDVVTFASVAAIIIAVGLIACYIPARRVLRLDPVAALRAE